MTIMNCREGNDGVRKLKIIAATTAAILMLTACAQRPPVSEQTKAISEEIEELRKKQEQTQVPELKRIIVPRMSAWLDQRITARFNHLDARSAIDLVVQKRPVRYNTGDSQAQTVKWSPSALTIRDHLDSITAQADWNYRVEKGVVQVYDIETRHFALAAQPGAARADMKMRNLSTSDSGGSDNTISVALDPYTAELGELVRSVLGLEAASAQPEQIDPRTAVAILPAANQLVVTAKPSAMRRVEDVIRRYNLSTSAIVRVHISIMEVDVSDSEKHSLLLDIVRQSDNFSIGLNIIGDVTGSAGSLAGIINNPNSRYRGSGLIYNWLKKFGDTSIAYDDTIEILNNHVASIDATRTESYVSKITFTVTDGGGSESKTPEVEFSELRTGLAIHLQPTVQDNQITLRMALSRSTLIDRIPFNYSGIEGETFVTDDFNRVLSVSLKDGEPKLLMSFSEAVVRDQKEKIPFLGVLGNSSDTQDRSRETIMMITANVVSG